MSNIPSLSLSSYPVGVPDFQSEKDIVLQAPLFDPILLESNVFVNTPAKDIPLKLEKIAQDIIQHLNDQGYSDLEVISDVFRNMMESVSNFCTTLSDHNTNQIAGPLNVWITAVKTALDQVVTDNQSQLDQFMLNLTNNLGNLLTDSGQYGYDVGHQNMMVFTPHYNESSDVTLDTAGRITRLQEKHVLYENIIYRNDGLPESWKETVRINTAMPTYAKQVTLTYDSKGILTALTSSPII